MEPTDRSKVLDRIKKCLRLAESAEPHEAAAALRQAQKMMATHNVSEIDIDASGATGEVIKTKQAFGGSVYLSRLTHLIQEAFGVEAYIEQGAGISRKRANVRYVGPRGRVTLAVYAHRVIDRCISTAWDEALTVNPGMQQKPGARQAFRLAFLTGINEQVYKVAPTEHERKQMNALVTKLYTNVVTRKSNKVHNVPLEAYIAGSVAAEDFTLHQPLDQQQGAIGHE